MFWLHAHAENQKIYIGKTSVEGKQLKKFEPSNPVTWKTNNISNTWAHGSVKKQSMIVISTAITDAVVPDAQVGKFETWKEKITKNVKGCKKEDYYASFLEDELIELCRNCDQFTILNSLEYHYGSRADNAEGYVLYMKFQCVRLYAIHF